jgi:hypothetical protein
MKSANSVVPDGSVLNPSVIQQPDFKKKKQENTDPTPNQALTDRKQ